MALLQPPKADAVGLGHPEVVGHHQRRQGGGELGHQVGLARLGHGLELRRRAKARTRCSRSATALGVNMWFTRRR